MKNQSTVYFAKCVFGLFLMLGNISLLGYLLSKNDGFAIFGFLLLVYGAIINLLLVIGIAIYGFADRSQFSYCLKSVGIICVNIPVAILYALIGLNLN